VQRRRATRGNNLVTPAQVGDNSRKAGGMKHLLVVEPDATLGQRLQSRCERIARATLCRDFLSARSQLLAAAPDLLVTNLRLEEYNGLHLVLLASADPVTRSIVHTDRPDPYLIREAQAIGAFFERTERLTHSLISYLQLPLPQKDRRDADRFDRRTAFRGGRRAADVALRA
jgi:DNA-binding NtrC family response regulator